MRAAVTMLTLMVLLAAWGGAQEVMPGPAVEDPPGVEPGMPDVPDTDLGDVEPVEPLGKTVKITVSLDPEAADEKGILPLRVVSAGTRYAAQAAVEDRAKGFSFEVAGTLQLQGDDAVLVGYSAVLHKRAGDAESSFGASGSVTLKPGQSAKVAGLGERVLILRLDEQKQE